MIKKAAFLFLVLGFFFSPSLVQANNLDITNVKMGVRNPIKKTVSVAFDITWENSWRNKINHDAVWLTVRLRDAQDVVVNKRLCEVSTAGLNPSGTSVPSGSGLEIYVPSDLKGAFLRRANHSAINSVTAENVTLSVDYASCGLTESSEISVTLNGYEMVFVPEGAFYAGDFATSVSSLKEGSGDDDPWNIENESALNVTNNVADSYYYVSGSHVGEYATGSSFSVPAEFPKGYAPFYAMKYEINEGQWVEFLNSLSTAAARANRDLTETWHKNSDAVIHRNTITCTGSPLICTTSRPARPVSFLTWTDVCAFLDWAALRPMTELEFEKLARGAIVPVKGEYAWGTTTLAQATVISGDAEEGDESVTNATANAVYGNATFSGGDSNNGANYQKGPLRNGIFATPTSDRDGSGAGNLGAMELSGNLKEWVVTLGNAFGLSFQGSHGDGILTTFTAYEGNANESDWPGFDVITERGVASSVGCGFKGGSWEDGAASLKISDRSEAANAAGDAQATYGGRGVRSYDGK